MAPSPRRRLYDVMDGKIIVHSPDRFDELFGDGSVKKASKIIIIIIINIDKRACFPVGS